MRKPIELSNFEFEILYLLANYPGRVFTYREIYEVVRNEKYMYSPENVMFVVRRIRNRIEPDYHRPRYIQNVRSVGYRFMA